MSNFDLKIWKSYRKKATDIGEYIDNNKDKYGNIILTKKELKQALDEISVILRKSSNYMDKCGLIMPKSKWRYLEKDTSTHVSSPDFKYKHLLNNDLRDTA
jgi:hypothetical protein